jgi:hypothetical protein
LIICPQGLDGLQTLASLRLSQNRRSEAVAAMNQVVDRLVHIRKVVHERTVMEEICGAAEPSEFEGEGRHEVPVTSRNNFYCFLCRRPRDGVLHRHCEDSHRMRRRRLGVCDCE